MTPVFDGLSISVGQLLTSSPWVLLALAFWMLMTGRLVPRSTHLDLRKDRDEWQEAHGLSEQARLEQSAQNADMIRALETMEQVIRALPTDPPRREIRGGR